MGKLPDGRYIMILTDAFEVPLQNTNCIELQFAVAAGPHVKERCERKYYYKGDIPVGVTTDFAKMGVIIKAPVQFPQALAEMVGSLIRVSLFLGDDAKQHMSIIGYVGRDNPSKYIDAIME